MPRAKPVTGSEIQEAVRELGINVPVRSAERKGKQIILHTRNGDYAYTPKAQASTKARTVK